jgi:septal ring factor EnvC (AmiA/AmiB activator)
MSKLKELQTEIAEKIKSIEDSLPSFAEFSLEQIQFFQNQLKSLEEKIKETQNTYHYPSRRNPSCSIC